MKKKDLFIRLLVVLIAFAPNLKAQVRVVCVGDSVTEGYGLDNSSYEAFPAQLGAMLGAGFNVYNCGVSGKTMVKASADSYWKTGRLDQALAFDPQIVIINLGTNDADPARWSLYKGDYATDYKAMISEFRKNGKNPIIFVCRTPPKFSPSEQSEIIKNEVIPIINQISIDEKTYIIDFYNNLINAGTNFPDGVHPNANGATLMAEIAYNGIKTANQIEPYVSVNGVVGSKTEIAVNNTDNVILKPLPVSPALPTDGTWTWVGPNGFTSNTREITLNNINITNGGFYIATYTNSNGLKSIQSFVISVAGCVVQTIVPYVNLNNVWIQSTDITINSGQSLRFGPQPNNGSWTWAGPNGFALSNREFDLNNIKVKHNGNFTATYTSPSGCQTVQTFKVTVVGTDLCLTTPIIPYMEENGKGWNMIAVASSSVGGTVKFGPQGSGAIWSWTGPNGFTSSDREFILYNIQENQFGTYTATNTNKCAGITTFDFVISNTLSVFSNFVNSNNENFTLYPNVNLGMLNIKFYRKQYNALQIYTSNGVLVYSKQLHGEDTLKIDISTIVKTGIYLVSLKSKEGSSTKKLIVK